MMMMIIIINEKKTAHSIERLKLSEHTEGALQRNLLIKIVIESMDAE
jgi:hypothetical protein